MSTILDNIIAHKKEEVAERKERKSIHQLEQASLFAREVYSLSEFLLREDKSGIIAEFKRHSPSQGDINTAVSVQEVTTGYARAGASALSVLTDEQFFKGTDMDLAEARVYNACPILRKDFVIDEYQIIEAKSIGADAILLIAECLEKEQVKQFAKTARSLGLEVLMEIHSGDQLAKLTPDINVVGVNNRNLKDFSVSIRTSLDLNEAIPAEFLKISESGISNPNAIVELRRAGYNGFLIGENFMKEPNPGEACRKFIERVNFIQDLLENAIA